MREFFHGVSPQRIAKNFWKEFEGNLFIKRFPQETMTKTAYIFPGQGSQYVGMSRSFYDGFPAAKEAFDEADEVLGFDLKKVVFEGPKEELDRTEFTQPALLVASIAALRVLRESFGVRPAALAGHSLGEYTALVAAGALDYSEAVRIVHLRGRYMQEAVPEGTGMMCAILGLDVSVITEICKTSSVEGSVVVPANINSPQQVVISGHKDAVTRAGELAREEGAKRVVPLQVSAPSHSPLMTKAGERLGRELEKVAFDGFSTPVITNVDAEPIKDASEVADALVRQLTSPVLWVDIVKRMKKDGIATVVEIGPGKVLTGLIKRIDKELTTLNLDEAGHLDSVLETLKGG